MTANKIEQGANYVPFVNVGSASASSDFVADGNAKGENSVWKK